ncbi:hypothetical protein [Halohasta salina]|uniref:hypothetical protein n=1 Tax=Halohasta salina TaxID=2961621 RepID=UPI0020A4DFAB|nr:hypothetical protein [Halohasta salina]
MASVTAASFASSTTASTNFSIVALEGNLVLRRLQSTLPGGSDPSNYSELADTTDAWNESAITDFGNVTRESNQNNSVVAYVNDNTNDNLEADLAFEARNTTYTEYTDNEANGNYGFFELANLGETQESVSMTFGYNSDNVAQNDTDTGTSTGDPPLSEADVAEIFTFTADGKDISPNPDTPREPGDTVSLDAGQVVTVELEISMTESQASNVQDVAGSSPFGGGLDEYSFQLIDSVTVGSDFTSP